MKDDRYIHSETGGADQYERCGLFVSRQIPYLKHHQQVVCIPEANSWNKCPIGCKHPCVFLHMFVKTSSTKTRVLGSQYSNRQYSRFLKGSHPRVTSLLAPTAGIRPGHRRGMGRQVGELTCLILEDDMLCTMCAYRVSMYLKCILYVCIVYIYIYIYINVSYL